MKRALALAVVALGPTQIQIPSPSPITGGQPQLPLVGIEDAYGPAQPEDLEQVAHNGESYHRRLVIVRGILADLVPGRYLSLNDHGAALMVIPLDPSDYHDLTHMFGMDVDVTGVARVLPTKQAMVRCLGTLYPESKCQDPLLPVLPDYQPMWPPVSVTVVKMADRGTNRGPRREGTRALADTGVEAAAADGKPVRALGQFRGANLCRDLPAESRRDPADWVLLTSEGPVWVTGRRPAGRGFQLDPAYRADTARWLEVNGKVQTAGPVRYIKASKVALAARPAETEPVPCPP